jgi:hypothetical protein
MTRILRRFRRSAAAVARRRYDTGTAVAFA